jgi:hypothetical protein
MEKLVMYILGIIEMMAVKFFFEIPKTFKIAALDFSE